MLVFLNEAETDIDEALEYYFVRSPEIALRFNDSLNAILAQIQNHPNFFPKIISVCQKARFGKPFPFNVIYTVQGDDIVIVAVAHDKRKPGYWKERTH